MVKLFLPLLISQATANGKVGQQVGASASASATATANTAQANARAGANAWSTTGVRQWGYRPNPQSQSFTIGNRLPKVNKRVVGKGSDGSGAAKWLPWGAWNECTGVCGQGVQSRVRRCLNGVAGIDCQGDSLGSKKCTSFKQDTCSYWSGWGAWSAPTSSCNPAKRCKTRTCYGRNTDHCEGPTECCEDVIMPDEPCTQTTIKLPAELCCSWTDPFCGVERTMQQCGPCSPPPRTMVVAEIPIPMPLCPVCLPPSPWEEIEQECDKGARRVWKRVTKCNPRLENGVVVWGSITPEYKKEMVPTICSDFMEVQPCSGANTLIGQCPGTIIQRRQCQCYSDVDTVDQFGTALVQSKTLTCGAPLQKIIFRIVDATNVAVPAFNPRPDMTRADLEVTCNTVCLNKGLKLQEVSVDPCSNTEIVKAEAACGINPPPSEWTLVSETPCPDVTCQANVFATQTFQRSFMCTGQTETKIENTQLCAINQCTDWSAWSTCDESFPAACVERERSRSRECACPGNQLTQTTTCAPIKKPEPQVIVGECLNAKGLQCGPGLKTVTTIDVCAGTTTTDMNCVVPIVPEGMTAQCDCPLEGEVLGREWRWQVATNPDCRGEEIPDSRQQYWCDTYPQEWTEWTAEWSTPTHECANQCDQYKYRCKTCDGAPSAACALKYGSEGRKSLVAEGGMCGREIIEEQESECNSRCGQEGTIFITRTDRCRNNAVETLTKTCINSFVPPARVLIPGVPVHRAGSTCCEGTRTDCYDAIVDQGVVCQARECITVDIAGVDNGECYISSDWSSCTRDAEGYCYEEQEIKHVCGNPIPNNRRDCKLGLTPWTWVGGLNVNSWLNNNPWNNPSTMGYCQFQTDDVNRCSGVRRQVREPICKNDPSMNYTPDELERSEACGLQFVPGLKALTPETIYANVPHYHPVGMWSECGMGVDLATLAASGQFVAEQVLVRKSKCPNWPDVEIRRPCPVCATTPFGEWSECSEDCGVGKKVRYQMCIDKDGKVLSTSYGKHETAQCGTPITYTLETGSCSAAQTCDGTTTQCGSGTRQIIKRALHPNSQQCQPLLDSLTTVSSEPCETGIPCPYWSAWSEVNYAQCHQEPTCLTSVPRFRTCQGASESCGCDGTNIQKVTCMANEPLRPYGSKISTMATDCAGKCNGQTYTETQNFICADPVIQTGIQCPPVQEPISPWGAWDRQCGQCDTDFIFRQKFNLCNNAVVDTEQQRCMPQKPMVPWGEWDASQCTPCGGQMVRRRVYPCPSLWPVEEQFTACEAKPVIQFSEWSVCSRDCWKDPSVMTITNIAVAKAEANQCGAFANAYSYSSIQGYESMDEVRSPGAWNDDGANLTSRPGYYPGYKGGWKMRRGINMCTQEVVTTQYERCGTCKCPARLPRSATAVDCSASADACTAGATANAMATATCDETDLMQPECAYLKDLPYFQGLCRAGNNQVSVQCTANAMPPTAWSVWGTCVGANGMKCASFAGEMGTYIRTRYEGCGNYCAQASQSSTCQLPVIPDIITQTAFVETQCAVGTNLGLKQATRTIKNGCTGAVQSEIITQGVDISTIMDRYVKRLVKDCAKTTQCGRLDVTRQEYEIYDKCTQTTVIEYGQECKATVCPYFSAWQSWESCSKSCGTGTMRRIRYCVGGEVGEGFCVKGDDNVETVQTAPCNRGECCNWEWSGWTGCCFNQARNRGVRYRFQLACGADQVTGLQGDCYNSETDNVAQAAAQATAQSSGNMAVATATATAGGVMRPLASCVNIGTDINAWRRFHNPDKKTLSSVYEFRVTGETNVDMSDPIFAAVSRAYMSASTSWRFNTEVSKILQPSWQYYGEATELNFPYGGGYSSAGATVNTGVTNGAGAVVGANSGAYYGAATATAGATASTEMNYGASSNASSVGQAVGSSATASSSSGASSSASASSTTKNTSSYMPNRFNFLFGK